MRTIFVRSSVAAWCFLVLAEAAAAQEPLSRAEIAKIAKPATVLVEVQAGSGSGFCIHPSGYFVTNEHVVRSVPQGGKITLVLDSSLKTQATVDARIVRLEKELDLALLKADSDRKFPALALGSDEGLTELAELVVFGFPFGKALDKKNGYPAITANVVNVSALRNDENHDLDRIQLDSTLNVGNSGGPVLDRSGKVVGVVLSGIARAGINNAIPVRRLRRFLEQPDIVFLPPSLSVVSKHKPAEFQAVASLVAFDTAALELELVIEGPGIPERRFPMQLAKGKYSVTAEPFPVPAADAPVQLEINYVDAALTAVTKDRKFRVGKESVKLSEVRTIKPGQTAEVLLSNGKTLRGPLADLKSVPVKLGKQMLDVLLADVVDLHVVPPPSQDRLACTIIARKAGLVVGRFEQVIKVAGAASVALSNKAAKTDAKKLEGFWQLELGESAGGYFGPRQGDEAIYIEKNTVLWTNQKGTERSGQTATIAIDPAKSPTTIDFLITRGNRNNQRMLGIYKFDGEKLVIATSDFDSENRPASFTTNLAAGVGRAHTVRTYVRVVEELSPSVQK